jgi:hypothetical protein
MALRSRVCRNRGVVNASVTALVLLAANLPLGIPVWMILEPTPGRFDDVG